MVRGGKLGQQAPEGENMDSHNVVDTGDVNTADGAETTVFSDAKVSGRKPNGFDEIFGQIVRLMLQSLAHKHLLISDLRMANSTSDATATV